MDSLFQPFALKSLTLNNRFVMSPMTRNFSPDGVPDQSVADYYARRAKGNVGLIITEGTVVERPSSKYSNNIPNLYGDGLKGWKQVVEQVHANGGTIAAQVWHIGQNAYYVDDWRPPAPLEGPDTMSLKDIEDTIEAYANAAVNAKEVGFDAIEIHAAHEYLVDQFFWDKTNPRTDHYGGNSIADRNRFAVELTQSIRRAVGPNFPIIMRISQWKVQDYHAKLAQTPKELEEWVLPLADAGVDIFHGSQRRFFEPEFEGSDLNFAGWLKKVTGVPTITVGSVGLSREFLGALFEGESSQSADLDELVRRFERGDFDLVAVGRALLQDPDWVQKIKAGRQDELMDFDAQSITTLY